VGSLGIIPKTLGRLLFDPDPEKTQRVLQAMLQMEKIDIGGAGARLCGRVTRSESWI
jgi:hypothetical protein